MIFRILLLLALSLLILSGCEEKKGSSLGLDDVGDYDFNIIIVQRVNSNTEVEYSAWISSFNDTEITRVVLKVNGETYDTGTNDGLPTIIWTIALPDNGACNYELTINETEFFEFNLDLIDIPTIDWPDEYNPTKDFTMEWNLDEENNIDLQQFWGHGWESEINEEFQIVEVPEEERNFIIPNDWFSDHMKFFQFEIKESKCQAIGELFIHSLGINRSPVISAEFEQVDYDYYFGMTRVDDELKNTEYLAVLGSYDGPQILEAEVVVDGNSYTLEQSMGAFLGYITLPIMGEYSYEVIIDGNKTFNFDLACAPVIDADWPDILILEEDLDLSWELDPNENAHYQELSLYAYNNDNDEFLDKVLSPAARNFVVPSIWDSNNMTNVKFDLTNTNYEEVGEILAFSFESSEAAYNLFKRSNIEIDKSRKMDMIKKTAEQLLMK